MPRRLLLSKYNQKIHVKTYLDSKILTLSVKTTFSQLSVSYIAFLRVFLYLTLSPKFRENRDFLINVFLGLFQTLHIATI